MNLEPLSRQFRHEFFSDAGFIGEELPFYNLGFDVVFSNDFLETVFSCYFCATDTFGAVGFEFQKEFLDVGVLV